MAVFRSTIVVKYDDEEESFTATTSWCEPAPHIVITDDIEGQGQTMAEALTDLAEQLEVKGF